MQSTHVRRERASWALYDFANTIFSMNVATLYFAVWFVEDLHQSNTLLAVAAALASVLVVGSVPLLGAISDARQRRKPWVVGFTLVSCAACAAIGAVGQGGAASVGWVVAAYVVANYAYQAAQPFYNAMMPDLAPPAELGRLSGIGTAVGYLGTIVGLLLVVPFFNGAWPGIGALPAVLMHALRAAVPFTASGGRVATFVPTAFLFLLFSLPLFVFCRDHHPRGGVIAWRAAFRDVANTVRDARRYPGVLPFIIASFLYQDAIGTIVGFMALYAVKAMHFGGGTETTLFLVLTLPAIVGSYLAGRLVDRVGARRTLVIAIVAWIALLLAMIAVPTQNGFWAVGLTIGLVFGWVPTAERPLLLALVPEREAGRFFSLMLLSSRAAAVAGPLVWGVTVDALEPTLGTGIAYRAAVLTVAAMFGAAWCVMRLVPEGRVTPVLPPAGRVPAGALLH
ncbi:MAG: MFS transporter [bacterium]